MRRVTGLIVLLALTLGAHAAPGPDETPARAGEWGFRPADGSRSETDPPAFVWRPQKKAATYAIQVARDPGFREIVHEADGLTLYCHCPPRTLGPGTYHWRFRLVDRAGKPSAWSRVRRFVLDGKARPFPMPSREDLLSRIPEDHPRLFFRRDDLPRLRALAKGRLKDPWARIVARCEKLLKSPVDVTEPLTYRPGEIRQLNPDAWRKRWWGNRRRVIEVVDGAATLAFAWQISEDARFATEARRLLLAACDWDPKGATGYRYNDEAGMPFAWAAARAYTWLHDVLSEEDRRKVRKVMAVRGAEMARHLVGGRHIWRPYSSHANRAWHWLGEVGTAFHGEVAGTGDAAWFAMNVFFCAYPVWSDDAGGWHEGLAYWTSYLGRAVNWLLTMKAVYGLDGFAKPFFSRAGDFALYVAPPGETMGGFGDLTLGYGSRRCRSLMSIFARMAREPSWQWYVDETTGRTLPGGYLGFLVGALPDVEGAAPVDRPSSVLFPGTGLAVLHGDLVNRDRDVQLMLKSSPMGTQSHGYESQNAFLLSVAGEPIFIRSGRRDLYGSPHHRIWMWSTRSVNSILVNGEGQRIRAATPLGRISRFSTSKDLDYVVGEAAPAYGGALTRFTRAVIFVKPHAIVILDAIEAREPSTFQWLLHAPVEMAVDGRTIRVEGKRGAAHLRFLAPTSLEITQTDEFRPPPKPWVKLRQWHLTASTTETRTRIGFVTLIRPYRKDGPKPEGDAEALVSETTLGCTIDLPEGRAFVVWRRSGEGWLEAGPLRTDAEAAVVVVGPDGAVLRAFAHDGDALTIRGEPVDPTPGER